MFYEAVRITETDLPVLTCAAVSFSGLGEYNLCIGARPGRAVVVEDKEGILKGGVNDEAIESFARYVRGKLFLQRVICVEALNTEAIWQKSLLREH